MTGQSSFDMKLTNNAKVLEKKIEDCIFVVIFYLKINVIYRFQSLRYTFKASDKICFSVLEFFIIFLIFNLK
jgi:hypothetical protein